MQLAIIRSMIQVHTVVYKQGTMATHPSDEQGNMTTTHGPRQLKLQHPTHPKPTRKRFFQGYGKYITPCYGRGTMAAHFPAEQGTMATAPPAAYGPTPLQLHSPTHPKLIPAGHAARYGKYIIPRARNRTSVKYRQVDYLEAKRDAANEKQVVVGCGNPKCMLDCYEMSTKSQELVRRLMSMMVFGCKDYSVLTKYLMQTQIIVKGPWTIQEEYQENKKRIIRLRKPPNKCRSGRGTCVWCRTYESVSDYCPKWGPLDCPNYR